MSDSSTCFICCCGVGTERSGVDDDSFVSLRRSNGGRERSGPGALLCMSLAVSDDEPTPDDRRRKGEGERRASSPDDLRRTSESDIAADTSVPDERRLLSSSPLSVPCPAMDVELVPCSQLGDSTVIMPDSSMSSGGGD